MKKVFFTFLLLAAVSGCVANIEDLSKEDIQKIAGGLSEEDIDKLVACKPPYMRFATSCCLDQNNNSICDNDERNDTKKFPDIEINPDVDIDVDIEFPSPTSTIPTTTTTSTTTSTAPSTTTSSTTIPTTSTTTAQQCDPSYPTVCIPPYPPDLNCGDITHRNFQVLEPDPHGFDGNNDGIGCQS